MLKILFYMLAAAVLCACSTSKNDAVSSETPMIEQIDTNEIKSANAVDLPYTFTLSGKKLEDKTIVTLRVQYNFILTTPPILTVTPLGDTVLQNIRQVSNLEMPKMPGAVTKELILTGTDPSINVSIAQKSSFMGVELHDSWPPKKNSRDFEHEPQMDDLPAQIEVEGTPVYRGVDVHP